jgi:hypothetical protein
MRSVLRTFMFALPILGIAITVFFTNKSVQADEVAEAEAFPQELHYLFPPPVPLLSDPNRSLATEHVAYGTVDPSEELEQPIAYSHMLHAGSCRSIASTATLGRAARSTQESLRPLCA